VVDAYAILSGEGDASNGRIADFSRKLGEVVHRWVWRRVEGRVSTESLETQRFIASGFAFCQGAVHRT
jgi:hypothetical protein